MMTNGAASADAVVQTPRAEAVAGILSASVCVDAVHARSARHMSHSCLYIVVAAAVRFERPGRRACSSLNLTSASGSVGRRRRDRTF